MNYGITVFILTLSNMKIILISLAVVIVCVYIHDRFIQTKHTLLKNYPVVGWGRYFIEALGPELRQYIVAGNREEN